MIRASYSPSSILSVGGEEGFLPSGFAKAAFDEPLSKILNGLGSTIKCISNFSIGPGWAISIGLQENLCTTNFLATSAELLYDTGKFGAFLVAQPNDVFLLRGIPPWFPAVSLKPSISPTLIPSCDAALETKRVFNDRFSRTLWRTSPELLRTAIT